MNAGILAIGEEITTGRTIDTNSAFLSQQLLDLGVETTLHLAVGDVQADIVRAFRAAADQTDLILVTGGLGPTADDLTRQALAEALHDPIVTDESALRHLESLYALRSIPLKTNSLLQAMRPASARMIANSLGTAPGLFASLPSARSAAGCPLFAMPGVPREMKRMWQSEVAPRVSQLVAQHGLAPTVSASVHSFGLAESMIGDLLSDLMTRGGDPNVGTQVAEGVTSVRIRSRSADAAQRVESARQEVARRLHPYVFGMDHDTLAGAVLQLLRQRSLTLATAESCTGGWLGKMITDVPGSSDVYLGGLQTYRNSLKHRLLAVSDQILETHGAVSAACAHAMATGALHATGAHASVSITGIAGPGGAAPGKPVGTVFVGVALSDTSGSPSPICVVKRFALPGDREQIRQRAAMAGLGSLCLLLRNIQPAPTILWEVDAS